MYVTKSIIDKKKKFVHRVCRIFFKNSTRQKINYVINKIDNLPKTLQINIIINLFPKTIKI